MSPATPFREPIGRHNLHNHMDTETPFMDHIFLIFNVSFINETSNNTTDPCEYTKHRWLEAKLILISICGTTVAVLGILGNVIIILVLTRPGMRTPNNLYLTFLAVFDSLLLLAGISLYSIEYIYEYLDSLTLYDIWIKFVRYGFALSHVAQTGSVYITVAVTFERYLAVLHPRRAKIMCTHNGTALTIAMVIAFSIIFNCTKYFEVEIVVNENCTGFATQRLRQSDLSKNTIYSTVHSLWLTQMIMVFIPFIVLFFVNTAIVWKVRRSLKRLSWIQRGRKRNQLKEKSKDATRVLVVIVLVFLICNAWGCVVTILENTYTVEMLTKEYTEFYAFSRETVNFLAIVNSSLNFVIYCVFAKDFRREMMSFVGCTNVVPSPEYSPDQTMGIFPANCPRRPSLVARYFNVIRRVQLINGKQSRENSLPKDSSVNNLRSAIGALSNSRSMNDSALLLNEYDKNGRGSWKKATISSGDYNGDFVSFEPEGEETPHGLPVDLDCDRVNGNAITTVDRPSTIPLSPWKKFIMTKRRSKNGTISSNSSTKIDRNQTSSDNEDCKSKGSRMSPDAEPLAPFLLGMMLSSAPPIRQAALETAMANLEDDVWV